MMASSSNSPAFSHTRATSFDLLFVEPFLGSLSVRASALGQKFTKFLQFGGVIFNKCGADGFVVTLYYETALKTVVLLF